MKNKPEYHTITRNNKQVKIYTNNLGLTQPEIKIISNMNDREFLYFSNYFWKVSPQQWATDLKHYEEQTYNISDVLVVIEGFL